MCTLMLAESASSCTGMHYTMSDMKSIVNPGNAEQLVYGTEGLS